MANEQFARIRSRGTGVETIPVSMTSRPPIRESQTFFQDRQLLTETTDIADSTGSRRDYHACKQRTVAFDNAHIRQISVHDWCNTGENWVFSPFWIPWSPYLLTADHVDQWINDTTHDIGENTWEDFQATSFDKFVEAVPPVLDGFSLLYDILTLKGLCKQLYRLGRMLSSKLHHFGAYANRQFPNLLTLRELVKGGANNFLLLEFGIKPIIREFEGMLGSATTILKRLQFLRKTQGSSFKSYNSESFSITKADRLLETADVWTMGGTGLYLRNISGSVRYSASAIIQNNLVGLEDFGSTMSAFVAGYGGGHPATFLWDLVPFSFVVDWCFNIDAALDRYARVEPFSGELKISRCGTSFKKVVTADLVCSGPGLVGGDFSAGRLYYKEYNRRPGLDSSLNLLNPALEFSRKQLEVLAALVTQRA